MSRGIWRMLGGWAVWVLVAGCDTGGSTTVGAWPRLERVILISCDTLSAQHLRSYGYAQDTATNFDLLAKKGVLFRHCLAPQGWTLTSHATMLTGLEPGVHRVTKYRAVPESLPLLAELLQGQGFRTAFFPTSNEFLGQRYGFARGCEKYEMHPLGAPMVQQASQWLRDQVPRTAPDRPAPPFLAFFHFMDTHSRPDTYRFPYLPLQREAWPRCGLDTRPPDPHYLPLKRDDLFGNIKNWDLAAYDPEFLRCAYDACVSAWDEFQLRRLLERLEESGHLDDTLVIVTADHGEQLGQHGDFFHDAPYGEVREVPLLLIWPGRLPAGNVVETRVGLVDLVPTILELAGLPPLPHGQGSSLAPLLADPRAPFPARDFLVDGNWRGWGHFQSALVAQDGDAWWSLVVRTDTTGTVGTYEPERVAAVDGLYNLSADPYETDDLRNARPDLVAALTERLEQRLAANAALARELDSEATGKMVKISAKAARKLKALGY